MTQITAAPRRLDVNKLQVQFAKRVRDEATPLDEVRQQTARASAAEASRVIRDNTSSTSLPRRAPSRVLVRCITSVHTHTAKTYLIINSTTHGSTFPSHSTTTISVTRHFSFFLSQTSHRIILLSSTGLHHVSISAENVISSYSGTLLHSF